MLKVLDRRATESPASPPASPSSSVQPSTSLTLGLLRPLVGTSFTHSHLFRTCHDSADVWTDHLGSHQLLDRCNRHHRSPSRRNIFCHRRRYTDSHCRPLLPSFAKVAPLLEHWQPVTRMASISRLPAKVGGDASISPLVISRTNSCESCYVSRFTPLCSFS